MAGDNREIRHEEVDCSCCQPVICLEREWSNKVQEVRIQVLRGRRGDSEKNLHSAQIVYTRGYDDFEDRHSLDRRGLDYGDEGSYCNRPRRNCGK